MKPSPPRLASRLFSERRVKRRILLIALVYFLFFTVIMGRTFMLHLADNNKLDRLAGAQYQKKVTLAPKRGNILDTHGEELAMDIKVDSLYANPSALEDSPTLASQLAGILGMDAEKVSKLINKDKKFVWIKRRISDEESQKVQALKQEHLGLVKEYKRFYPNKNLAATILGAVGLDSVALGGLELFYDSYLKSGGQPVIVDQDAHGRSYNPDLLGEKENLHHVVLTLDKTIQFITEKELAKAVTQAKAKSGIAVVMNNKTGEVLAMASYPDFDPNQYTSVDPQHWKNRAVTDSFEPGSIFKAITAAAALESGKVSLDQKFNCEGGAYRIDKFTINDHGKYGAMSLPEIIRVSSNIGSLKIAQYIGREAFGSAVEAFGFGTKTGIDLPGEARGIMARPQNWGTLQMSTIAFGQGISVTPIQVVTAYSAIANGGYLMKPFIVKRVEDSNGKVIVNNEPKIVRQVMHEANAKKLVEMLKLVVGPGGTGMAAQVEEYGTAGKTGTAQKVVEGKKGYSQSGYIGSFVGIAPADNPHIVVLVSINEPQGSHFGGVVAAPAFREIVRQVLPYMGVKPLYTKGPTILTKQDQKSPESQAQKNKKINPKAPFSPEQEEVTMSSVEETIPIQYSSGSAGNVRLPDCDGMALRTVLKEWEAEDLKVVVEGSGVCVGQDPPAGQWVKRGSEVRLSFKPPS